MLPEHKQKSIYEAIVYASNQGLSKNEILEVVDSSLPKVLHDDVTNMVNNLDVSNNHTLLKFNDLQQLFCYIFHLVNQGYSDEDILNKLSISCNLEQFEFAKFALRYITINRIPSVWELDNVYNGLFNLDISELVKRCETI